MIHKLSDVLISERVSNLIIDYQFFTMYEYIDKNGNPTDNITEPVIVVEKGKSFIEFVLGKTKHLISLPNNEWQLKKMKKYYYILHILMYPRSGAKVMLNKILEKGTNGSLCYIKKGAGAVIYLELDREIEKSIFEPNNILYNFQQKKRKPTLNEEESKWVSINTFLI